MLVLKYFIGVGLMSTLYFKILMAMSRAQQVIYLYDHVSVSRWSHVVNLFELIILIKKYP